LSLRVVRVVVGTAVVVVRVVLEPAQVYQ